MKKIIYSCLILFICISTKSNASDIKSDCYHLGGEIVSQIVCPQSERVRRGQFCVLNDEPLVFFNGCTGGVGRYKKIFYKSCFRHDNCYHHEPATYNLTKKQCDDKFHDSMVLACVVSVSGAKEFAACRAAAWTFYQAVRVGGNRSWECSNSKFNYRRLKF